MTRREAIDFIIQRLIAGERNLHSLKRDASRKFGVSLIKNPELLACFPKSRLTPEIKASLVKKPAKTMSGVTPVAVMIRPQRSCGHACIYCPFTGLAAKSYVGFEPAALRGRQFSFDPFLQASNRVAQFESGGHATDKCEVIVMGGTFLETKRQYKRSFIKGIYDALNGRRARTLQDAMKKNQRAKRRVIGLTIETRPDSCTRYIDEMLSYGATRVELGVQHADDRIYRLVNRGHTVKDVTDATRQLKDSAFKVSYHIMPGLPGSSRKKDISFVRRLFKNSRFRPDMLKIYPTLVIEGTTLHGWTESGRYNPYSTEEAADIISEFYRYIPKYVRVMRIQRDIPAPRIGSGVKKSNLRELVERKIREKGIIPQEIRYREIRKRPSMLSGFTIERADYEASGAKEIFLSYENEENLIAGFLRLRLPKKKDGGCALLRELHVYGTEAPLKSRGSIQHRGLGTNLLKEAERIAIDAGRERMVVISGVGAREYYVKHGYRLSGPYMIRNL